MIKNIKNILQRKLLLSSIIFSSYFLNAQHQTCTGAVETYKVDFEENNGEGSIGSIYVWNIDGDFQGEITPLNLSSNQIQINWGLSPVGNYEVHVTEISIDSCISTQSIEVLLTESVSEEMQTAYLCIHQDIVEIHAPAGYQNYTWYDGENNFIGNTESIFVHQTGIYTVNFENGNCIMANSIEVIPVDFLPINVEVMGSSDILVQIENNTFNVQYQLKNTNGILVRDWQSSPLFTNIPRGIYWVVIQAEEGNCIYEKQVNLLQIPNIITPNGDGKNDVWNVNFLDREEIKNIMIYDRYGKKIALLTPENSLIWNGLYLGKPLPADTYWYIVEFKNASRINGSISLIHKD